MKNPYRGLLFSALALCAATRAHARHDTPLLDPVSESAFPAAALHVEGYKPSLPGAPFVIDAGHGGEDLGAVVFGRREKDLALQIALKVKQKLEARSGIPARMTRDTDLFVPLDERVELGNRGGLGFISLHLNQVRSKRLEGITVYAFGKSPYKNSGRKRKIHSKVPPLPAPPKEQARASAAFADVITRSLRGQGFKVEPPIKAGFYVLKNPTVPSVLVELGYMSNPEESARLADPAYQDRLADALAVSLQHFAMEWAGRLEDTARAASKVSTGGR